MTESETIYCGDCGLAHVLRCCVDYADHLHPPPLDSVDGPRYYLDLTDDVLCLPGARERVSQVALDTGELWAFGGTNESGRAAVVSRAGPGPPAPVRQRHLAERPPLILAATGNQLVGRDDGQSRIEPQEVVGITGHDSLAIATSGDDYQSINDVFDSATAAKLPNRLCGRDIQAFEANNFALQQPGEHGLCGAITPGLSYHAGWYHEESVSFLGDLDESAHARAASVEGDQCPGVQSDASC